MFFKYGAMNSGKSIDILKVAHNYEEQGKPVELLTSGIDDRAGTGVIASRIGLKRRVTPIMEDTDVFELIKQIDHRIYQIGGNESYYPVCREHYFHPDLPSEQENE